LQKKEGSQRFLMYLYAGERGETAMRDAEPLRSFSSPAKTPALYADAKRAGVYRPRRSKTIRPFPLLFKGEEEGEKGGLDMPIIKKK